MEEIRLPLDLLIVSDAEDLENGISSKYAVINEAELIFCKDEEELEDLKKDLGESVRIMEMDEIETDRIRAVIDLLTKAEEDNYLSHLLDRMVR
jgi:hypothetical protein